MTRESSTQDVGTRLRKALSADDASRRLQAALTAGTRPDPAFIEVLVERCAVEPDFSVREMLTWALIRHDHDAVLDRLLPELRSAVAQARSQALHTLTKIAAPATSSAITTDLMQDADDQVARTAWRAAAELAPRSHRASVGATLATQFARGDRDVQLSLSRAFAVLGDAAAAVVAQAQGHQDEAVRAHAIATERIMADPEEGFDAAIDEARKVVALRAAPSVEG